MKQTATQSYTFLFSMLDDTLVIVNLVVPR
jgi:hypothetical protein